MIFSNVRYVSNIKKIGVDDPTPIRFYYLIYFLICDQTADLTLETTESGIGI